MSESTRINTIRIIGRHRKDFSNVDTLAASIKELGVLQPILITPDLRLIAGERRIRAAQSLGHETIPSRVVSHLSEAALLLKAERDENVCRQEMTVSERVSLARQIEALEKPKAAERRSDGLTRGTEPPLGSGDPNGLGQGPRSEDIAANAVDMSRITYRRAKYVIDTAEDETAVPEVRACRALGEQPFGPPERAGIGGPEMFTSSGGGRGPMTRAGLEGRAGVTPRAPLGSGGYPDALARSVAQRK